ncbi:MAG: DUF3326 domain-containing protein, partial [Bacteroidales bacterium]|nr:DUF3326 domain-containing protein [Bacteroidales bacterium]
MRLFEKEIKIPIAGSSIQLVQYLSDQVFNVISEQDTPIRFVITKTDNENYHCELGLLSNSENHLVNSDSSIFSLKKRQYENTKEFNCVLLIPTGIGAEIGGHCGDGNAVARLIATSCDTLITHPNVVNASDINEMTENTLYVEGSIITRLLMGQLGLQKVRANKILMLMDEHEDELFNNEIVNAVSSARISLGISCDVIKMRDRINSISLYSGSGRAVGQVENIEKLFGIVKKYIQNYDAIGLSTFIKVPDQFHKMYFTEDNMINPWGGIEAMLTHSLSLEFNIPSAHSPMMSSREIMDLEVGIVEPRKAPETSSVTYLHCILKGLHKSPRLVPFDKGLNVEDISCLIIPDGCVGLPTLAAIEHEIPVIAVRENKNRMQNNLEEYPFKQGKLFIVDNYLEAVGVMNA